MYLNIYQPSHIIHTSEYYEPYKCRVFKQMGSNYPPPPHHQENSVYHVQVVIKDNETVTAPYTVLLH